MSLIIKLDKNKNKYKKLQLNIQKGKKQYIQIGNYEL